MQQLDIETGQNVIISKDLANIGERIAAQLIDYAVMFAYILILSLISGAFNRFSEQNVFFYIALLPIFFYALLSEIFLQGQSLGKKALNIKVVKLSGASASIGTYIIRWLFKIIEGNIVFLFGSPAIIIIAGSKKGQRLGDVVAKTSVISLKRKYTLEQTIFVELPESYSIVFPEVEKLELSDIKTIKDVVFFYKRNMNNPHAHKMILKTSTAVKKKTGIETSKTPLFLLENLLSDYNFIHKKQAF